MKKKKRYIGVIPPHEVRHKRYLEQLREAILPAGRIIPGAVFYKTSYERVLQALTLGFAFDVILAARLKDAKNPGNNNITAVVQRLRREGRATIFLVSFNELLAQVQGLDVASEKAELAKLRESVPDPNQPGTRGVIWTSSTDPLFLISILGDVLDNPAPYLAFAGLYHIETQADFLNHPPEHTLLGISQ